MPQYGVQIPLMPAQDSLYAAKLIRDWLLQVLAETGWSPREWATRANVAASTVQRAIKPDYQFVTSSRTLAKLAEAAGRDAPNLKSSSVVQLEPKFLEVRYRAQAGNWAEVEDLSSVSVDPGAVSPHPAFAQWPQWLELVEGDSADRKIKPGAFAHVVDAIEMGYAARHGDWVIVERRRDNGRYRERSIKQVEIVAGRVELWPRSTNPRWSSPLVLGDGAEGDETVEVEIVGYVIGAYERF
jgi:hypothetical protein